MKIFNIYYSIIVIWFFLNTLCLEAKKAPDNKTTYYISAFIGLKNAESDFNFLKDSIPTKFNKTDDLALNKIDSIIISANNSRNKNKANQLDKTKPFLSEYKDIATEIMVDGINKIKTYNKDFTHTVLAEAKNLIGTPYKFGGTGINGIDCSAFIQKIFESTGFSIPRKSSVQATMGFVVKKEELKQGDLVFFNTRGGISHVGIISEIVDGIPYFIHSSSSKGVVRTSLESEYWAKRYITARRISSV
ncbi:MAG: C40 family peptidase [Solirubrobacteraceae bacterium]